MMNFHTLVRNQIFGELQQFNQMNYHDPLVTGGIMAVALTALADIQYVYDEFDGECEFDYDPEPYLEVKWWLTNKSVQGVETFRFRFDPLRIEDEHTEDPIAAYDRAMKVL